MDPFHERLTPRLDLGRTASPGEINRHLKSAGFTLDYDVYSFPRPDPEPHPTWQSRSLISVYLFNGEEEVDAQDECDAVELRYPLATIDSALVERYLSVLKEVQNRIGGTLMLHGAPTTISDVEDHITKCISSLMEEWGEEPGSKNLRLMIEASYPR